MTLEELFVWGEQVRARTRAIVAEVHLSQRSAEEIMRSNDYMRARHGLTARPDAGAVEGCGNGIFVSGEIRCPHSD